MYQLSMLLGLLLSAFPAEERRVEVMLSSSYPYGGQIHLAVYDSAKGFAEKNEIFSAVRDCDGGGIVVEVPLPAEGSYVIAAFHDLNGNGLLDSSIFGAPTEPYGFATPPPSRWRTPAFSEIATNFSGGRRSASVRLKHWKDY